MPFKVQVGPPQIAIHEGQTVLVSDPSGQIDHPSDKGLYFLDTRLISAWAIYANGACWDLLNGGAISHDAARIFLLNKGFDTEDGPALGFHRAGRWDEILPIEECLLTTGLGNAIRDAVRDWAREERLEAYDQATHGGYLRHLVVREGRNTGQVLVQLVTGRGRRFEEGYLVEVLRRFPEVRSIHWAVNDGVAEVTNLPTTLLWGEEAIEEEILGLRFRVRPNAFLQTNTEMAEALFGLAREYAGLRGGETVYDLYCGTGTIGLALAPLALTVWGVEISEESVACAIENAELNAIANAAFFAGNVSLALEELSERAGPPDVVVVDPPRAGLAGKALRRTGRLQAPRLVYVSCNPTTLAADLRVLRDDFGYALVRCRPVDMFPHTPHIESVSLLELARPLQAQAVASPGLPDQVGVGEQEADRNGGKGGEPADVQADGDDDGEREQPGHASPGPAGP